MIAAGISHQDCPLRDIVTPSPVVATAINGVLVVEATAGRVEFNHLVAHDGSVLCSTSSRVLAYGLWSSVVGRLVVCGRYGPGMGWWCGGVVGVVGGGGDDDGADL